VYEIFRRIKNDGERSKQEGQFGQSINYGKVTNTLTVALCLLRDETNQAVQGTTYWT
jgi:hypothetical protein